MIGVAGTAAISAWWAGEQGTDRAFDWSVGFADELDTRQRSTTGQKP